MDNALHLIKLCVGAESVQDLRDWQASARARGPDGLPRHITRMWPKRADQILQGGALYWVIKGVISCRQTITRFDEVTGADGIRRCAIVLDPQITLTAAAQRRPFQGWRYLDATAAPPDLTKARSGETALPRDLEAALAEIGVL